MPKNEKNSFLKKLNEFKMIEDSEEDVEDYKMKKPMKFYKK